MQARDHAAAAALASGSRAAAAAARDGSRARGGSAAARASGRSTRTGGELLLLTVVEAEPDELLPSVLVELESAVVPELPLLATVEPPLELALELAGAVQTQAVKVPSAVHV